MFRMRGVLAMASAVAAVIPATAYALVAPATASAKDLAIIARDIVPSGEPGAVPVPPGADR